MDGGKASPGEKDSIHWDKIWGNEQNQVNGEKLSQQCPVLNQNKSNKL